MSDDADEPTIPRAALNKLIKDNAPHIRVANETRDLLHACCLEFVKFVGAEANRICADEQRKTISHEHAARALETLGFSAAYQEAALSVLDECKEAAQKRLLRQNSRLDKCGIPEDELLKRQQELFEKARLEQAEQEQNQLAWFQKQIELAQQMKQENGAASDATDSALVVKGQPGQSLPDHHDPTSVMTSSSQQEQCNQPNAGQATVLTCSSTTTTTSQRPIFARSELDEDYDAPE